MNTSRFLQFLVFFLVLFVAAETLLPWLSLSPVYEVSEGREGVVVQEMLESQRLLLPLRHGELVPSKPPLFHWISYALASLRGEYSTFELRLPSALAGIGILGIVFLLAAQLSGIEAALLSAGALLTSYGFLRTSMDGRVDMVLCFFVVSAIATWVSALRSKSDVDTSPGSAVLNLGRFPYLLASIFCGLGILAKGPIGLVFPLLVIGGIAFQFAGFRGVFRSLVRWEWLIALVLSVPWYVAAYLEGKSSFIGRQIFFENVDRFVGATGITPRAPWFYFVEVWTFGAPLTFLLIPYACTRFRKSFFQGSEPESEMSAYRFSEKVSLTWLITLFLFLSLSVGKRRAYLDPLLPALAMLWGNWMSLQSSRIRAKLFEETNLARMRLLGWSLWSFIVAATLLFTLVSFFFPAPALGQSSFRRFLGAYKEIVIEHQAFLGPWFFALIAIGVSFFSLGLSLRRMAFLWLSLFTLAEIVLVVLCNVMISAKGITHGYESLAMELKTRLKDEQEIHFVKTPEEESFDGFFFLFGRRILLHSPSTPLANNSVYLARRSWVNQQSEETKHGIKEIFVGGRLKDTAEEQVVAFRFTSNESPPLSPPSDLQLTPSGESNQVHHSDSPENLPTPTPLLPIQNEPASSKQPESATPHPEPDTSPSPQAESTVAPLQESESHLQTQIAP